MIVVYVLGNGSKWRDGEIKHSIRSLVKHCKDLTDIYVIGNCPGFLKVNYIEHPDESESKEISTLKKVLVACEKVPDEKFFLMNDDFFFLQDFKITELPTFTKGNLEETIPKLNEFKRYRKVLQNTYDALIQKGLPTIDFEAHNPVVYDRDRFKDVMKGFDLSIPYCMKSLYFNSIGEKGDPINDMKVNIPLSEMQIKKELNGKLFFSVGDFGLNPEMKSFLAQTFADPSPYEAIVETPVLK